MLYPPFKSNNSAQEDGFTLIELIVVSFLIGLLLTFTIPTFNNTFYNSHLKISTKKLLFQITEARIHAKKERHPYVMYFDLSQNRVWYQKEGVSDINNDNLPVKSVTLHPDIEVLILQSQQLNSLETNDEGFTELWISKEGYINQTTITLTDDEQAELKLHLSPFQLSTKIDDGSLEDA